MNNRFLLLILLVLSHALAIAQLSIKSKPVSFNISLNSKIPLIEIQNTADKLPVGQDKIPVQAGYTLPFNYTLSENGIWNKTKNSFIWRLKVVVPGAVAVNLYFKNINLEPDDKLFLYNQKKKSVLGAYTSSNNGLFMCSDFVQGDTIIIELNSHKQYKNIPFSVYEVGVLLENSKYGIRGFGDAGSCEVHVNCVEGENWQEEKKGIARILLKQGNKTFWCTGSLINNTKNDGTPYFLTANHCGESSDSSDYAQWLFYFDFESENCIQPQFQPELKTLSGASLLAHSNGGTSSASDFKLLLLKDDVPPNYMPYFNGWNRTEDGSSSGVTIHHPQGDLKMISTYESPLVSTRYDNQNEDPDGKYWKVYWNETVSGHGVTEGGSSGSPIFNNQGYIIGSLTGGSASCTDENNPDYYGKFSYSWESNGEDSTSQLKYWLDPLELGITALKGTNLDSTNIFAGFSVESNKITIGESASFINTSFGNISAYNWYFEGGDPGSSEMENPGTIKYDNAGSYDVRLIVSTTEKIDTLTRVDYIKVLPNISPNPTNGKIKLAFGQTIPDNYSIRVFDALGRETGYRDIEKGDNYLNIHLIPKIQGIYFINFTAAGINNTFKVVVVGELVE